MMPPQAKRSQDGQEPPELEVEEAPPPEPWSEQRHQTADSGGDNKCLLLNAARDTPTQAGLRAAGGGVLPL